MGSTFLNFAISADDDAAIARYEAEGLFRLPGLIHPDTRTQHP